MKTRTRFFEIRENSSSEFYGRRNLDDRLRIYQRVMELKAVNLPYSEIITRIACEFGVRIPKSTTSYWTRDLHNPLGRSHTFSEKPTRELAYIIGVMTGDGSLNTRQERGDYRIRLQSIDREFVEEFDRCLSEVLNSSRHTLWKGTGRNEIHLDVGSYLLHRYLQRPLEELKPTIENDAECSAAFLRGFFDSEGCVDNSGSLTASNTNRGLLNYVKCLLMARHGIETTGPNLHSRRGSEINRRGRTYHRNSDCFAIRVRNKSRLLFAEKIGMTINRKSRRLLRTLGKISRTASNQPSRAMIEN